MRAKGDIAKRLEAMGVDPLEGLVRIARRAEDTGNDVLAAKILGDILSYTAPKLKSMEVSIEPQTQQFLERQARLQRIQQLLTETKLLPGQKLDAIEGEVLNRTTRKA